MVHLAFTTALSCEASCRPECAVGAETEFSREGSGAVSTWEGEVVRETGGNGGAQSRMALVLCELGPTTIQFRGLATS